MEILQENIFLKINTILVNTQRILEDVMCDMIYDISEQYAIDIATF